LYRKGFSVATIGLFLVSIFAAINPVSAVVPAPASYQLEEYAWLKEDGVGAQAWAQYNNTGWNRLNLSYRYSKVNLAYVARSAATADDFNVTFIVYHNTSAADGFNTTGHLYSGSSPELTRTVPAVSTQTAGLYTYHLFITTWNPSGVPGDYQVRINETGPGSGSSWTALEGNPNVHWMFFYVPTTTPDIIVTDQLGREQPFYLDGASPSTSFNGTMVINPPGNNTGATSATVEWIDPAGSVIQTRSVPIYFVPGLGWAAQNVIAANTSAFPFNATDPYTVRITMGFFVRAGTFYVLSSQWITVSIDVTPTMGQWFDPSSLKVTFTAQVNTGVAFNPYQDVDNVTLQFWNATHYQGVGASRVLAYLSWNITGYPVIAGSSYTYTWTGMIPASWIDVDTLTEFFGTWGIRSVPTPDMYPATIAKKDFYVDDPIEGYMSIAKASTTVVSVFEQKSSVIWANVEYDPTYLRTRQNSNAEYDDKDTNITWYWQTGPTILKPPGNDETTMSASASWPSDQEWAFSTSAVNSSWTVGAWWVIANATADTGYVVRELITYTVVYKALYLEIWSLWDEYEPCMKKTIAGKTYYLDENNEEVPVDSGFFIYKLVDPMGRVFVEPIAEWYGGGEYWPFPWTNTETNTAGTEALGAIWDEIPTDAAAGTWTVYAMVLGADETEDEVQTIGIYSYQGPATDTFEVAGEAVHLKIDDILAAIADSSNMTWELLGDALAALADIEVLDEAAITLLDEVLAALGEHDDDVMAKLGAIEDYVKEIRALALRIDRWQGDNAAAVADLFAEVLDAVDAVNGNVNDKWTQLGDLWQVTFYGVSPRDPRSLSYKINQVRTAAVDATVNALSEIIAKLDTVNAGLGEKLANILSVASSEVWAVDASVKAQIASDILDAVDALNAKVDGSTAVLGRLIGDSAAGLHARFAGVVSEVGYVSTKLDSVNAKVGSTGSGIIAEIGALSDKVDKVNEKVGGVQSNIRDKVDAVDASVGMKLLVAIILVVIVLILCLLPIVAPGFRMKE
jgi:hypothetical protein